MRKKIVLTCDLHYGCSNKTREILNRFYENIKNPDYLIIAGDVISHKQAQWEPALKQLREHFDCPILIVMGNHDLWQYVYKRDTLWGIKKKIMTKFSQYDITYLPHNPVIEDNFKIYGFDGWYGKSDPPSRDLEYLPSTIEGIKTHDYLKMKGLEQLNMIPDKGEIQQIVVTHFGYTGNSMSGDSRWLDILNRKCDILCVGHSHQHRFENMMDMQILNSGSDYDDPKLLTLWVGV